MAVSARSRRRRLAQVEAACALALVCSCAALAAAQEPPVTIEAVPLTGEIALDGRLSEPVWESAPVFSAFVQQVPATGAPATDRTEVRVLYDDRAIYFGVRAFQSSSVPIIANELRRDAGRMHTRNDTFSVALDTFHDRRNGSLFIFNALGAVADWAGWDEGRVWSQDWDTVWDVRTSIEEWGWTAEMRLPFRSLRFPSPGEQLWGVTFRRVVLGRNEWSYSTFVRPEWGEAAIGRFSSAAELRGVRISRKAMNLELTPYALGGAVATSCGAGCDVDRRNEIGGDAKYGITSNLTLDLTYNTDFSQVEADEQQVNFTRFNLFFPEKRQFFLEGKGIFDFGITGGEYRLLPFFSRRIGLEGNQAVPIAAGARLTGKAHGYSLGALAIGTETAFGVPGASFAVARVRRDVLRRSSIGFIATDRRGGGLRNESVGIDANLAVGRNGKIESLLARAWSPGRAADSWAGRFRAANDADLIGGEIDYVRVGANFNPEIGFVGRRDVERWFGRVQVSPRPRRGPVRKLFAIASVDYAEDGRGRLESRELELAGKVEFHSADIVQLTVGRRFDRPLESFRIGGGLVVPAGAYGFDDYALTWTISPSRPATGTLTFRSGDYYGGSRREFVATSILKADRHFYADVNYQVTDVALPAAAAVTQLFGVRLNYSATTRVFSSTLLQWNNSSREFNGNVRLNWIYRPGSNLYVVFTRASGVFDSPAGLISQSFVVKLTRLLQF
jgi:hypothetical protein